MRPIGAQVPTMRRPLSAPGEARRGRCNGGVHLPADPLAVFGHRREVSGTRQGFSHDGKCLLVLAGGSERVGPFAQGSSEEARVAELPRELAGATVRLQSRLTLTEPRLGVGQSKQGVD